MTRSQCNSAADISKEGVSVIIYHYQVEAAQGRNTTTAKTTKTNTTSNTVAYHMNNTNTAGDNWQATNTASNTTNFIVHIQ